ncbi:hypothetical protein H112_07371 [Trichophyton rubrum D6]|uniref:Uncharacterized protein n=2 Tax=Trichophyton TaxID=5550 RepID=A0A022VSM5_TRIRU|nr:hypothetical protein H100_07398 [Trichophyton rubrum MR850]EZF38411.1 hypothetical protein H102_07360 [Trichophyton rubrum CBS 100081]EZF49075.1 hypothetical protein H103_07382 [Trichophyton rubrum CBS 288.86]EZF70340.1 hypothetical protein H105_07397 [Trichophyton soudanense CBS 452.61]EZF80992.1 hypothetical protein H110_07380 [Trichophyton rubrum MR1448]EZF91669.1 hypothetical protein H113_07434 [Trichophyton rubrum MR1459]EZG13203.1 hypothetical protein H107_07541 [Trichophyton rubrum 
MSGDLLTSHPFSLLCVCRLRFDQPPPDAAPASRRRQTSFDRLLILFLLLLLFLPVFCRPFLFSVRHRDLVAAGVDLQHLLQPAAAAAAAAASTSSTPTAPEETRDRKPRSRSRDQLIFFPARDAARLAGFHVDSTISTSARPSRQRQRRHQRRAALLKTAGQSPSPDQKHPHTQRHQQQTQQAQQRPTPRRQLTLDSIEQRLGDTQQEGLQQASRQGARQGSTRQGTASSYWPAQSIRVSPSTTSAILWVLEEAIRTPYPFTADPAELNASMSELFETAPADVANGRSSQHHHNGVAVAAGRNGMGPGQQPMSVPAPSTTGATHAPSGVRTPTDIMRRRRERERAQLKAEQEAKLREEQLQKQAQLQLQAQAQAQAQAQSQTQVHHSVPNITVSQDPGQRQSGRQDTVRIVADDPQKPARQRPNISQAAKMAGGSQQQQQQQQLPDSSSKPQASQSAPGGQQEHQHQPQQQQQQQQQQPSRGKAAFPHAFERWEMLSSHWEGLTSYWIRRLEQNNEELSKDPLSQQMSRQVTDLSAAGANLFHAVVELQRLRASSERKFQRWFFDTRAEQERAQEVRAELERMLSSERQARADAVAALKQAESDKAKAQELAREVRRELQISRDEARRAWEELGRREQEERDRTISLRNGEPTIVGGVQVVPMLQSVPSRHTSTANRPPTREGPYPGGPSATSMGGQSHQRPLLETTESTGYDDDGHDADPFIESGNPPVVPEAPQPPRQTESGRSQFYQHNRQVIHGGAQAGVGDVLSEDGRAPTTTVGGAASLTAPIAVTNGGTQHVSDGRQLSYPRAMSDDSDDYTTEPFDNYVTYGSGPHGSPGAGTSSADESHIGYPAPVDYSGSGWGVGGSGWDSVTPRHRHPTRLSDVLEEDERSRTSPSRASQTSRNMQ